MGKVLVCLKEILKLEIIKISRLRFGQDFKVEVLLGLCEEIGQNFGPEV